MKPRHAYGVVAVWCVVFFALVPSMCAQEAAAPRHTGVPQDWSQGQIVFSRDGLARHPDIMNREPRVLHQAMQRWAVPDFGAFHGAEPLPASANKPGLHRDWNLPLAGRPSPQMFPAKFSIDPNAPPDCTKDYVVFGLSKVGVTGGQANLVALNNLYVNSAGTGFCPGTAPNVMFAYNTTTVPGASGGRISTSPIISLDGKKIGFVESVPGASLRAIFHVLTWTAGQGAIGNAAAPASMTSLTFSPTKNSTTSSPWIDYGSDTVYLGADNGVVYQITGVFNGTPTLTGAPWPVLVASNNRLTPPVLDSVLGLLMVGAGDGNLYQIDPSVGAIVGAGSVGQVGGTTPGILAPPIVDITNGTTFAVSANDGTSAVLVEFDTASMTELARANIGLGSTGGTAVKLLQPAFSNDYYNDPNTGVVSLCGTGASDTTPWQYVFGFTGSTVNIIPSFSQQVSTNGACSGWTELFNPFAGSADTITATSVTANVLKVTASNSNLTVGEKVYIQGTAESFLNGQPVIVASLIGLGPTYTGFTASFTASNYSNASDTGTVTAGTDFFFFGLTRDCTLLGSPSSTGCVVALSSDPTIPTATVTVAGGPSGIVVDNYSTAAEASSIYLTAANVDTAYKFTQNGLH